MRADQNPEEFFPSDAAAIHAIGDQGGGGTQQDNSAGIGPRHGERVHAFFFLVSRLPRTACLDSGAFLSPGRRSPALYRSSWRRDFVSLGESRAVIGSGSIGGGDISITIATAFRSGSFPLPLLASVSSDVTQSVVLSVSALFPTVRSSGILVTRWDAMQVIDRLSPSGSKRWRYPPATRVARGRSYGAWRRGKYRLTGRAARPVPARPAARACCGHA